MNYLAHAALSYPLKPITLGNIIADHVRGRDLSYLPEGIAQGVRLHRQIDRYFDNHPQIIELRALMPQGLRRFSGIAIDFWFDHLLAKHWSKIYAISLSNFQQDINQLAQHYWQWIPQSQRSFIRYLIREALFIKYQSPRHINANLELVARRLKHGEQLMLCMKQLSSEAMRIEVCFHDVYPQVTHYCHRWINTHVGN
jgi:acyl carrier protein phosphodiesterase